MGDNTWTTSTCRSDVMWYGVPGQGTYYWTARYGQYWVGGGLYQRYAAPDIRWECGPLGAPVKAYQWLTEFGGVYGQWFEFGAIYYKDGAWRVAVGNYGQTAGRLAGEDPEAPADAEVPPDAPSAGDAPDTSEAMAASVDTDG